MAETRTYNLGTTTIEQLGASIETFLRAQRSLEVEGIAGPTGYLVQARQNAGQWRKFVGLDKAIQVRILSQGSNLVTVSIGEGKWIDKVAVGAAGALWFPPLLLAAGVGAAVQAKLVHDVLAHIESYLILHRG
jgi:hypothetical protein